MKTTRTIGIILALVIFSLAGHRAEAQSQEPQQDQYEDQEKELELEARRQRLKQEQLEREMNMKQKQLEQEMKMKQMEIEFAERASQMVDARERERARIYVRSSGDDEPYFIPFDSNRNQTQLTLRNTFRGGTDSSTGEFDVDETTRSIRCMINGKVNAGEIRIVVKYPNGKLFRDMTINSSAEISFNQSLTINEEEGDKYIGSWKYEVSAEKAEGNYMLQISTN